MSCHPSTGPLVLTIEQEMCRLLNFPDSILCKLFGWTVAMGENQLPPVCILSNVCRHWRVLSIDCPLLWTDIHIPIELYDPLVFFERSAPALFNVTFNSVWMQDRDIHAHVSKAILNNVSRLRCLTIEVTLFDEIAPIFEAWRDSDTPNLIDLGITCHDNSEPEKEIIATSLRCGDSLNRVKLKGLRLGFLPVLR